MTPGSAVRLASVARHVTDCVTLRPGTPQIYFEVLLYCYGVNPIGIGVDMMLSCIQVSS